jgi:hypothetical protein
MRTGFTRLVLAAALAGSFALAAEGARAADSRIATGFEIAPVPLNLQGLDRDLVGLGSYIVNAPGDCNGCHSSHEYLDGHDPFLGQPAKIDRQHYLAGGRAFGPIISANLTPDRNHLPGGMTLRQFVEAIRHGQDPEDPKRILQVMPWPTFSHMQDRDIRAIYEYLRAIPSRGQRG